MFGGGTRYVETLDEVLAFVRTHQPTTDELIDWHRNNFTNVESRDSILRRISYLQQVGFLREERDRWSLGNPGREYVEDQETETLLRIMCDRNIGLQSLLYALKEGRMTSQEISDQQLDTHPELGWGRGETDMAKQRANWLRSMGLVQKRGQKYELTDQGLNFVDDATEQWEAAEFDHKMGRSDSRNFINEDVPHRLSSPTMANPIEIVRDELWEYSREIQGDVFHLNEFTDFAEAAIEGTGTERSPASTIRNTLTELHQRGEITYLGRRRYRIQDESLKAQEDSVELQVTIEDPDGEPIEYAEVRAEGDSLSETSKTNSEGICEIEIPESSGEVALIVDKSGFLIDKSRIKFHGQRKRFWLTLEPLPEGKRPPNQHRSITNGSVETSSYESAAETDETDDIIEKIMQDLKDDL